jgi:hypothetical protein
MGEDLFVCQIYVDDIIFGSTNKSFCDEFSKIMTDRFEISIVTPCVTNSLIMIISVLMLHQIPWLIHFQEKPKEFQMDFNLKSLWESQEIPKFWNSKLLLMSLFIIQLQSGSSSSNCSHSRNF